ncbi:tyrosine-protein phosphatase [Aquabacterium sp.]|uniref:protein-tyrosine phosphatase family protein n=1 Tax=Aquabacterium sp. TaxID=1872578 RepID=UPI0035B23B40
MPTCTFRSLALPPTAQGALWLSSMPGRLEPWPDFLSEARRVGLTAVVCLNPLTEVAELSPAYHAAIRAGELPFRFNHIPMRNFGLAAQADLFRASIEGVADELQRGEVVLLHCAAGMGRTGTVAACLLKRLGLPKLDALDRVRAAGSNPESAVQSGLVDTF